MKTAELIEHIINNQVANAKDIFLELLVSKIKNTLMEHKKILGNTIINESGNIIKQGKIIRIRRRIRRNAQGRIIIQRNVRHSALKGYRVSGSRIQRIPAIEKIRRSRLLKQSWRTSRRAQLRRTLMKRRMSMQRRVSMGI